MYSNHRHSPNTMLYCSQTAPSLPANDRRTTPKHTWLGPDSPEQTAHMSSFESIESGGTLDLTRNDNMTIDTTHLGEFLHPILPTFGQGVHATSTLLPMWATFSTFTASAASTSMCDISPNLGLETLCPSVFSDTYYGLEQVQEGLESRPFDERTIRPSEYDIPTSTPQELPTGQASWTEENLPCAPLQQIESTWIASTPVLEPASIPSCESEPRDWPTDSSLKSDSLPSISSLMPDLSEVGTPRLKKESPSSYGSGSSFSSKWMARRTLSKKVSRTQSQSRSCSRRDSTQSDFEDDGGYGSSSDYAHPGKSQKEKTFACPLYRMDPMRHMDCISLKLMRIRDVKQHINRKHTRVTYYSPRCWATFPSPTSWEKHIIDGSCKPKVTENHISVLGVSKDMQRRLASRVDRKLSSSEQWYTIWRIIFGGATKKPNPYLGTVVEETVGMMKDYWQQEGDEIVRDVLAGKQISTECAETSTLLKDLFAEVQARFEQKICQSGGVGEKSGNSADNTQQSMLPPSESDITMKDTQVRSTPPSDWIWIVPEPRVPQSVPSTSSISSWSNEPEVVTDGLGLFQAQASAIVNNNNAVPFPSYSENNQAPGWMPENAAHQQMGDENSASRGSISYEDPKGGVYWPSLDGNLNPGEAK